MLKLSSKYIGRFAPSPTGRLHFGSLVTAIASYLRARSLNGTWLVRIEDVDLSRNKKGAASSILNTLEDYGLYWDNEVIYQSKRSEIYNSYLATLQKNNLAYNCICTRKEITKYLKHPLTFEHIYSGKCRNSFIDNNKRRSVRLNTIRANKLSFKDLIQGDFSQEIESEVGDFILWRSENSASYQLAVVIDDELQGVSEVVRGSDLLFQTPRQIFLQNCFSFQTPFYAHIPLVLNNMGQKLSKQTKADAIFKENAIENICQALYFLGYELSLVEALKKNIFSVDELMKIAIKKFDINKIPKIHSTKLRH